MYSSLCFNGFYQGGIMSIGILCGMLSKPAPDIVANNKACCELRQTTGDSDDTGNEKHHIINGTNVQKPRITESTDKQESNNNICKAYITTLKNSVFLVYCFSSTIFKLGYPTPLVYIPQRAVSLGVSSAAAAGLLSFCGISNMVGRSMLGWIHARARFFCLGTVLILEGLLCISVQWFTTYPLMVIFSVICGIFLGKVYCSIKCTPNYILFQILHRKLGSL